MNAPATNAEVITSEGSGIAIGSTPDAMTRIYEAEINAAIWDRQPPELPPDALALMGDIVLESCVAADGVAAWAERALVKAPQPLRDDVIELAEMYACLFEVSHLGIRLKTLERPMCPRFHVDHVVCRLLTTYEGAGTEYLLNDDVDRRNLGRPVTDISKPPVLNPNAAVQQLPAGAVLLCKGESWPGNEGYGFVHRSPDPEGRPRLMLSIDGLARE